MSALLTRIEFDIDVHDNKFRFFKVCRENNISEKYIRAFVYSATVDNNKVFNILGMKGYE